MSNQNFNSPQYSEGQHPNNFDFQEERKSGFSTPLLFVGAGVLGGALIGAIVFFMMSPKPLMKEQVVEMSRAEPARPVEPVKVEPLKQEIVKVEVAPTLISPPTPPVFTPPSAPVSPPPPVVVAVAPPPPAALPAVPTLPMPELNLPRQEVLALLNRARNAMSEGDVSQARSYLERAAKTNDAVALLMLAETYDPEMLKTFNVRGIRPNPSLAKSLYEKAMLAGEPSAKARFEAIK